MCAWKGEREREREEVMIIKVIISLGCIAITPSAFQWVWPLGDKLIAFLINYNALVIKSIK